MTANEHLPYRTISAMIAVAALTLAALPASAEDLSDLLLQKTQEFSDAGQQGNAAVLNQLLDPNVIFVNETGQIASKDDIVSSASPPPAGMKVKMTVMDWRCQIHGDIAITSFIDDQAIGGQSIHNQFRSVETWAKEGQNWRIIASETLTLPIDPPTTALPAHLLDSYAGTYVGGSGLQITFTRQGDELMASVNGASPNRQAAEAPDIFFTPGYGQYRKVFQRDLSGKITGFVYLRAGHDLIFKRTG